MYHRYEGNSGRSERVPEPGDTPLPPPPPEFFPPPPPIPPPPPPPDPPPPDSGLGGLLRGLLRRLEPGRLETEDLMLAGLFYLLWRESGDVEFLYLAGGVLFL